MTKREVTALSYKITGCAIKVHKALGPGLLESVYEKCLIYELVKNGLSVRKQLTIPIVYDELVIETALRVDLLVNDCIVVELKAIEAVLDVHKAQLLTCMKLLKAPQGLLINFNSLNIVKDIHPFVNQYFKALK